MVSLSSVHRLLRLLCLIGAIIAVLFAAQVAQRLANLSLKEIGPIDATVPEITRMMVVDIAEGSFPIMLIAGIVAAVIGVAGLYAIFSPNLSPAAGGTILLVACTLALMAAVFLLSAMGIAISVGRSPVP